MTGHFGVPEESPRVGDGGAGEHLPLRQVREMIDGGDPDAEAGLSQLASGLVDELVRASQVGELLWFQAEVPVRSVEGESRLHFDVRLSLELFAQSGFCAAEQVYDAG